MLNRLQAHPSERQHCRDARDIAFTAKQPEGDAKRELSSGKLINARQVKVKNVVHVEQRMSELRKGELAGYAGIFDRQGPEKPADLAPGNLHAYSRFKPRCEVNISRVWGPTSRARSIMLAPAGLRMFFRM